jgi:signal transduction histidine kinase
VGKYIDKNKFLIIALLLFIASYWLEQKQANSNKTDIKIAKFEQVLHQKEKKVKHITDSLANIFDTSATVNYNTLIFPPKKLKSFEKQGFSFLIFVNDSLKYWTDNYFDTGKKYSDELFDSECNKIGSYWLDIYNVKTDSVRIIGAYRIKEEYKIHNKYLRNKFQQDLDLPDNISISLIPLSYGIDIKNANGDYLLSLIPNNKVVTNYKYSDIVNIILLLSILFLIIHFHLILEKLENQNTEKLKIFIILTFILIGRILMFIYKFPLIVYSQDIFDSANSANSLFGNSIGDLYTNLLVFMLIAFHFFKYFSVEHTKIKEYKPLFYRLIAYVIAFFSNFLFLYFAKYLKKFVYNTPVPLDIFNILNLTVTSYILLISIGLLLAFSVFLLYKFSVFLVLNYKWKNISIYVLAGFILASVLGLFIFKISYIEIIFLAIFELIVFYFLHNKNSKSLHFYTLMLFLSALFVTNILIGTIEKRQTERNKLLAVHLTNQRDDVAELLLKEIDKKLTKDPTLPDFLEISSYTDNIPEIENYLKRRYFNSYWNKYDLKVYLCRSKDFGKKICKYDLTDKQKMDSWIFDKTYFVKTRSGKNYYLLEKDFKIKNDTVEMRIWLSPRLYPSNIGYPELLLDESVEFSEKQNYSFAKYQHNHLISKSGDYNYPLNGKKYFAGKKQFYFFNEGNLKHLVYTISSGNYIVLTYKRITALNALITFSYVFLLFVSLLLLVFIALNFKQIFNIKNLNFRTKLMLSMLVVLTLSFSLVGTVTVLLNISQYRQKHNREVFDKLQELNISISQKYANVKDLKKLNNTKLNLDLRHLSEVFGTDVNLYTPSGFLLGTSRPEIYSLGIIGKRISSLALYNVKVNTLVQFVLKERISLMKYSSAYAQIIENNKLKFIINIPYFTNPDSLKRDISNLIVSIINIYVVLFVFALILSILMSEQIISPLIVLQNKFKKLELGKKYEKIEYRKKDEIGELVNEYNKMVDKLQESIDKLQKSERENAWRDMAKQIAHEIKNPLTPMKLSIQLLMRSWENQDSDFDQRIRDVSETLIKQIETLRRIAEEFSDFAKMPKPQEQIINLANKIEEVCKLYENSTNVEVIPRLQNYKKAIILADEKQISRALINLIKNAIQAIPEGVKGKIIISLDVFGNKAVVKISDNGSGIPEEIRDKLFAPSFTTKSSGMGLGLTMVKNIVENAHGNISFKSQIGKGTTFILEFPLYSENI